MALLCRLALEQPRLKTSARCCSEISACYVAVTPSLSFSWQYTLSNSLVVGTGKVSRSAVAAATSWMALAKVGHVAYNTLCYGKLNQFN
jgi:hypothetical protein